jgi:hypothetical protein
MKFVILVNNVYVFAGTTMQECIDYVVLRKSIWKESDLIEVYELKRTAIVNVTIS